MEGDASQKCTVQSIVLLLYYYTVLLNHEPRCCTSFPRQDILTVPLTFGHFQVFHTNCHPVCEHNYKIDRFAHCISQLTDINPNSITMVPSGKWQSSTVTRTACVYTENSASILEF